MSVAKVIELTASSPKSIEDAVENGIKRADYIEALWKVLNWEEVERRLKLVGFK